MRTQEEIHAAIEDQEKKLNVRQIKFAYYFDNCGNRTQAAKDAGYSQKTAYTQGHKLAKHAEVKKLLDLFKELRKSKWDQRWDGLIEDTFDVAEVKFSDYAVLTENGEVQYLPSSEWPEKVHKAIKAIQHTNSGGDTVRMNMSLQDANKTKELLGKMLGKFTEDKNATGNVYKISLEKGPGFDPNEDIVE